MSGHPKFDEFAARVLESPEAAAAYVLAQHRFNKGLGRCDCGEEMPSRGHRMAEWRAHAASALAPWIRRAAAKALREAADLATDPDVPDIYALADRLRARADEIDSEPTS